MIQYGSLEFCSGRLQRVIVVVWRCVEEVCQCLYVNIKVSRRSEWCLCAMNILLESLKRNSKCG